MLRMVALLCALCCLCGAAAAQEPAYAGTRAFVAMLRQAEIRYEAEGVDEYGEECVTIPLAEGNLHCFFPADGSEACFIVWYLIEYAPENEQAVLETCNRLNMLSDGPRFCVDDSDCSVTVMMDVALPWSAAGDVAWQGYRCMEKTIRAGWQALAPLNRAVRATPAPTATPAHTATPAPKPTATPAPARTATATASPTPAPEQPSRVVVTAATARVRSGPGVTSPYLFTAHRGDVMTVIGVSGDWYIITSGGRTGFISQSVVQPE